MYKRQEYTLLLKGQMTHRATLGTDPRGNLNRIDNALAQMPQRLEAAKAQLDNLCHQQAAAKEEVGKPFLYEEELRSKNARLVELDLSLIHIWRKRPHLCVLHGKPYGQGKSEIPQRRVWHWWSLSCQMCIRDRLCAMTDEDFAQLELYPDFDQ